VALAIVGKPLGSRVFNEGVLGKNYAYGTRDIEF